MKFTKMHGLGNDYVYVDGSAETIRNKPETAVFISDRHTGIGADGLIIINPSDVADFEMEMYNADGSRGEMCGNGIRCVGKYVYDRGLTDKESISVETLGGIKYLDLEIENGKVSTVTVDMGKPILKPEDIPVIPDEKAKDMLVKSPIKVAGNEYLMTCVSMGNPHRGHPLHFFTVGVRIVLALGKGGDMAMVGYDGIDDHDDILPSGGDGNDFDEGVIIFVVTA